jgi:predicted transcriptional regulator
VADAPSPEDLSAQLVALDVTQFVAAAASTIASLAYAKLEAGDLDQARQAIDALVALCPHVGGELRPDLERTVASLQLAYAAAASP